VILLLDNYDSFTYNLADYFKQLGVDCLVFRNDDPLEEVTRHDYKGVVFSPGPEVPEKAGHLMYLVRHYEKVVPMLGICLGHQAIGQFYGARLIKASKPMHGKISQIDLSDDILFSQMPEQINVVRYNSLILDRLPPVLNCISYSDKQEVMAIRHKSLPIWGVQFHPEAALTEHGLKILKNWLENNDITV